MWREVGGGRYTIIVIMYGRADHAMEKGRGLGVKALDSRGLFVYSRVIWRKPVPDDGAAKSI